MRKGSTPTTRRPYHTVMHVIAVAGMKGGAGKTTLATSIAAELARLRKRVLLVDLDPQGTALFWGQQAAAADGGVVVQRGAAEDLAALRAAASYDYIVLDGPPRYGDVQRAMVMHADLVVLPCCPSPAEAWAFGQSAGLMQHAKKLLPALPVVVAFVRLKTTAIARTAADALREAAAGYGLQVLRASTGARVAYEHALNAGRGVTVHAPRSLAAGEVRRLTAELLRHLKRRRAS